MGMAEDPEKQSDVEDHGKRKGRDQGKDQDQREEDGLSEPVEEISDPDRPPCPRCGWHNTRLSHTKSMLDSILRSFSLRAFRCRSCGNRFRASWRPPKP
jgi:hypothetical protein